MLLRTGDCDVSKALMATTMEPLADVSQYTTPTNDLLDLATHLYDASRRTHVRHPVVGGFVIVIIIGCVTLITTILKWLRSKCKPSIEYAIELIDRDNVSNLTGSLSEPTPKPSVIVST